MTRKIRSEIIDKIRKKDKKFSEVQIPLYLPPIPESKQDKENKQDKKNTSRVYIIDLA